MTAWQLYWITRLSIISGLTGMIAFLSSVASVVLTCVIVAAKQSKDATTLVAINPLRRLTVTIASISLTVFTFTPTTKEAIAILVIPKIVNNQEVQTISKDLVDLAKQWLEELKPKKDKDK